jgi:hypothetical protein
LAENDGRMDDPGKIKNPRPWKRDGGYRVATLIENSSAVFLLEMVTESPKIPTEWFSISLKDGFMKLLHRFAPPTGSLQQRRFITISCQRFKLILVIS